MRLFKIKLTAKVALNLCNHLFDSGVPTGGSPSRFRQFFRTQHDQANNQEQQSFSKTNSKHLAAGWRLVVCLGAGLRVLLWRVLLFDWLNVL